MNPEPGRPPRIAEWIIALAVPSADRDAILGDLDEIFHAEDETRPRHRRLWYWGQAVLFTAYSANRLRPGRKKTRTAVTPGASIQLREAFMVEEWWREVRVAVRTLSRKPTFVFATAGTLALGIGANTAIFSVINGAILRPLPFPEPDRLVMLSESWKDAAMPGGNSMNPANFVDLKASVRTIEGMAPYTSWSANLSGADRPQRVRGLMVGHEFFSTLGVQPTMGRDFSVQDDTDGSPHVTILTHELWESLFGSDPDVVGRDIVLNSAPHMVIAVLEKGTEFPGSPQLFAPLQFVGKEHPRAGRMINAIGRLTPGATLEMAQQDMVAGYAPIETAFPDENGNWSAWANLLHDRIAGPRQRRSLYLLGWSAALVLLIACLNVANLLLVRAETRQRELALRMALGAGRARLIPHFLAEGLLLSAVGGALGVGVGFASLQGIKAAFSGMLPRPDEIQLDSATLLFAIAVSVGVGLVVGLVPILRVWSRDLQSDLRGGARGSSGVGGRTRQILVISEIALAVVILSVAGLIGSSFYRVARIDTGLEKPEQVLLGLVALGDDYEDARAQSQFYGELMARISALPGVRSTGISNRLPLYGGTNFTNVPVVGNPERVAHFVEWRMVTPGFFDAVGVRLEEGRMMDASDAASDSMQTIMITRELARQLFAPESALGQRIDLFDDGMGLEVIGVVSDLRDMGHERAVPPGVYAAIGPAAAPVGGNILIRSATDPLQLVPQVREVIRSMNPNLPLYGIRTLDDVVRQRLGARRFSMSLLGIFAVVAVLLAAIGIYGVMSFAVTQRTKEMGVRLALGAKSGDVIGLILKNGLRLTVLGLGLGLAGAWFSSRWISAQLFEVEATDPLTYGAVMVVLAGVSMLASYIPARRASRTDPLTALRAE